MKQAVMRSIQSKDTYIAENNEPVQSEHFLCTNKKEGGAEDRGELQYTVHSLMVVCLTSVAETLRDRRTGA